MKAIAIDGPAGAGKSTIARLVANILKLVYIDTGAMFRAVAYYFITNNLDYTNIEVVGEHLHNINIELKHSKNVQLIYLNGIDVSHEIRTEEVSKVTSYIATIGSVREMLLNIQRKIANESYVSMDGRDIGTCVLPHAQLKIFLYATPEERAKRRHQQLSRRGKEANYEEILEELKKRDEQDSNREIAPLKKAEDAILIDSTNMTVDGVVNYIVKLAKTRGL